MFNNSIKLRITLLFTIVSLVTTTLILPTFAFENDTTKFNCSTETMWFDDNGNSIDNAILISKLENGSTIMPVGYVCCTNQKIETYYREEHLYEMPLPSLCVYNKYRTTYCANCDLVISDVLIGSYTHTHQK